MQGRRQIDLVEAFAYPLPVAVICELLGVPAQDEQKFHAWSKSLIAGLDPKHLTEVEIHKLAVDRDAISAYLGALIKEKRRRPNEARTARQPSLGAFSLMSAAILSSGLVTVRTVRVATLV